MTMFYSTVQEVKARFGSAGKFPNAGRWVNPVLGLGALVLTGYLMIGHPSIPIATTPAPHFDAQLALGNEAGSVTPSGVAHEDSTGSPMTDVLNAALGTVLAAAWLMGGAWVGIHSARISIPPR